MRKKKKPKGSRDTLETVREKEKKKRTVLYSPATVVLKLKSNKFTNGDNTHFPLTCFTHPKSLTILSMSDLIPSSLCVKYLRGKVIYITVFFDPNQSCC